MDWNCRKNTEVQILSFKDKVFLITGGAGSLGRRLTETLISPFYEVSKVRVLDTNENGLAMMRRQVPDPEKKLRFLLGDICDKERIRRAMDQVDIVIACAAQKHIDLAEYNPFFCVLVNVVGTQNCIEAALDANVERFLYLSSDKAVQATSTYGRCKALAESLTIDAANYKGDKRTVFSIARPPNFTNSDGSVFEVWKYQKEHNLPLTVTNENMVRYFMKFEDVISFVINCIVFMKGKEIFIPLKSEKKRIIDLAREMSENIKIVGLRPGEKLEELLIDPSEMERAEEVDGMLVIK